MNNNTKLIDFSDWDRASHYDIYANRDYPYVGFCSDVELTRTYYYAKQHGISLFNLVSYAVLKAANDIPEFRMRVRGEKLIEHGEIRLGFIAMTSAAPLFSFGVVGQGDSFAQFDQSIEAEKKRVSDKVVLDSMAGCDDVIYTSCLPWLRFTSFVHPVDLTNRSTIPLVAWGKIEQKNDVVDMPVSVQVNHGLMDGWHISQYYMKLQEYLAAPEALLPEHFEENLARTA